MFNLKNTNELSAMTDEVTSQQRNRKAIRSFKQKKHSGFSFILATVVVTIAALALTFAPTALNVFAETTMSPAEYYQSVENSNLEKQIDAISESYGNYLDNYNTTKKGIGSEVTLKATFDPSITTPMGFEGLKSIQASIQTMQTSEKSKSIISLFTNDTKFTSLNLFTDSKKELAYIIIPELSKAYLKLSTNSEDISGVASTFTEKELTALLNNNPLSEELLNKLLKKYTSLIVSEINNVEIADVDKVTAGDVTANYTKLTVKIDQSTLISIAEKVIKTARADKELKNLCIKTKLCTNAEYNKSFLTALDSIEEAKKELANTDSKDALIMKVWVDGEGNITGREFSYDYDSVTTSFGYKTTKSNLNYGFEAWYTNDTEALNIVGNGAVNLNGLTGNVKLTYKDEYTSEAYNVKLENVKYTAKDTNSYINGKFTITSDSLPDMKLVVSCTGSSNKQAIKVDYKQEGVTLVSILLDTKTVTYKDFKLPTKSSKIYDIDTQMEDYMSSCDIVKYLKTINKKIKVEGINALIDELIDSYSEY